MIERWRVEEAAEPLQGGLVDRPATRSLDEVTDRLRAFHAGRMVCVKGILVADRRLPIQDAHCNGHVHIDQESRDRFVGFIVYENVVRRFRRVNDFKLKRVAIQVYAFAVVIAEQHRLAVFQV